MRYTRWSILLKEPDGVPISFRALQFLLNHPRWRCKIACASVLRPAYSMMAAPMMLPACSVMTCRLSLVADDCLRAFLPKAHLNNARWFRKDGYKVTLIAPKNNAFSRYGAYLSSREHAARAERLLYEEKTKPASRLLLRLPVSARAIATARIALLS